jgi:hypothetical protein
MVDSGWGGGPGVDPSAHPGPGRRRGEEIRQEQANGGARRQHRGRQQRADPGEAEPPTPEGALEALRSLK